MSQLLPLETPLEPFQARRKLNRRVPKGYAQPSDPLAEVRARVLEIQLRREQGDFDV